MSSITGRYTGSPETAMEMDLARLRGVETAEAFRKILDDIIVSELTDDFWNIRLPMDLSTSSSTSPSLYAYYAALFILGANGLFSRLKVSTLLQEGLRSNKSALERHHLFPKKYLEKIGIIEQRETNQIANFALVEWSDNISISDTPPDVYLPKYLIRMTEEEKSQMYYWHALPDNWESLQYFEFLNQRRKKISIIIKEAYLSIGY